MPEKKNLDSVQILRGVAALSVVAHHACHMVADNGPRAGFINQLGYLGDVGAGGVDIFFVISGFIMVYVSRRAFGQPGAATEFLRRRILRIVPLYWLYTTAMLAMMLLPFAMKSSVFSVSYTLKSYFFIPEFSPAGPAYAPEPLLSPGWTLYYEMFFYFVFAVWLRIGRAATLLPYLAAVFAVTIGAGHVIGAGKPLGVFFSCPIVLEFFYGAAIGLHFVKQGAPARGTARMCIALALAGFAATATIPANFPMRWLYWGVPASLLVYGALAFQPSGRIARLWIRLGDSSYTLYLLHGFVTITAGGLLRRGVLLDRLPPDLLILATIAACVVISWWAYLLIEKPLTSWIARRFPGPAKTPQPTALSQTGSAA